MIVFDLKCAAGHVFEAWFGSSVDYDEQRGRGLVCCPICESAEVTKAAMAPAVPAKGGAEDGETGEDAKVPMQSGGADPANVKRLLADLAREQAKMLENSDYVGENFAREARAMHDGEKDERAIHGETSLEDARSMLDDGVPVAPLPLPVRPPGTEN